MISEYALKSPAPSAVFTFEDHEGDDADADESEGGHGEPHHRAAVEGDAERLGLARFLGGRGGADVGLGGGLHPEQSGRDRAETAEDVRHPGARTDGQAEQHSHDEDERDQDRVFPAQEGHRAGLDLTCERPHFVGARRLGDDVAVDDHRNPEPGKARNGGQRSEVRHGHVLSG